VIEEAVTRAEITAIDDLGTAAPLVEMASLAHETLYTRLFRS
jgi:urease accessory protein